MTTKAVPRIHLGYGHGLTQPATLLSIHLPVPPDLDVGQLERWLEYTFELVPTPRPGGEVFDGPDRERAAELAWRVLQLAALLLRCVKVPAFDPGRVLEVAPAPGEHGVFQVQVAMPFLQVAPPPVMQRACHLATDAVIRLGRETGSPRYNHPLAEEIHRTFIEPAVAQMPGGGSTVPLLDAAHKLGVPFRHVTGGVYQLGWGWRATLMDSSSLQVDSGIGAKISHNKFLAASMLRAAGLPVPTHRLVFSERDARSAFQSLDKPVAVKPVDRDRGEGVTIDVADEQDLLTAARAAAALSRGVLVEKQVPGVCHRLFVSHGRLLFGVKRMPKSVKGDGIHTVAQLIEQANAREQIRPPWLRLKPFPSDALALENLAAVGMTLDTVPEEGEYGPLRRFSSVGWGGVVEEVTDVIHPDNRDIVVRAATLFGLTVAGVDLITPDITVPWQENGAIINEVNYSPFFNDGPVSGTYLSAFIRDVFPQGDGRIPVEVYVGGERAWQAACERRDEVAASGTDVIVTSETVTLDAAGTMRAMPTQSLFDRAVALLMDRQMAHLILAVHSDELAQLGLPVDRIDRLTVVDRELRSWGGGEALPVGRFEVLHGLLESYSLGGGVSSEV